MKKKLTARRGETLTEVLVAILVVSMSIVLLTGMVNASMSINYQMRELDGTPGGTDGFYHSLADAETHAFDHTQDDLIIIKTTGGPSVITFDQVYRHTQEGRGNLVVYGKEG